MSLNRKNLIDGLPSSYDFNYIIKNHKHCVFCNSLLTNQDIELNKLICTENFEFIHKDCIQKNNYEIVYSKKNDISSLIKLKRKFNLEPATEINP